ncbi:MAG: DcaP family trimeric outer membrane transporter [Bacteroidota bacterium]
MKKILLFIFSFLLTMSSTLFGQDSLSKPKINFTFGGFVNANAIYDSRQVVEVREGFMAFYPKNKLIDKNGEDINAHRSFNQYAMTTRLNVKVTGPDVLGAKSLAFVESDFTGASNSENNSLRLRHAYIKLSWNKTQLLMGQYWHPLDVPEALPFVVSLNTGAPFHSFSRQPQIRLDHQFWKFNLVLVAASQRDYTNSGPIGLSYTYLRNSVVPNLHAQLQFKLKENLFGIACDYKRLTPRLVTDSNYQAHEFFDSYSYLAFAKLSFPFMTFKLQGVYGQNLYDHSMMGGYGVSAVDAHTNRKTYESLNYLSTWVNIMTTGKRWQFGVFAGYLKNLGTSKDIIGSMYARDADIYYVYRVAPLAMFISGKFNLAAECEYTVAAYGIPDSRYHFKQSNEYANIRFTLSATYNF